MYYKYILKRKWNIKQISVVVSFLLLVTGALFQNCSGGFKGYSGGTDGSSNGASVLPPHNYFTETRPASLCGKAGYEFLMRQYLVRHCGSCHSENGPSQPTFADAGNLDLSYFGSSLVTAAEWRESILENQFCGSACSLDERGEVYEGFEEWLSCR